MSTQETQIYAGKDLEAMSFAENYHRWILDEFYPYLHGDVAEVGAGSGNFTMLLANAGIDSLTSFEPSKNMYPLLERKMIDSRHVTTVNGFFDSKIGDCDNRFDTVVYVNVLEHIDNDLNELQFVFQTLKEGGVLCVFVPALSWLYGNLDKEVGHFRRYHKHQLSELVKQAGFEIEKIKYFDMPGIVPWYILFVLLKRAISGNNVSLYDKMAVPFIRKIESIVPPPVGKNLLLVCKKPK